jgi:hypothetical protein
MLAADNIEDVSSLLRAWSEGDERSLNVLTPIVYKELHPLSA